MFRGLLIPALLGVLLGTGSSVAAPVQSEDTPSLDAPEEYLRFIEIRPGRTGTFKGKGTDQRFPKDVLVERSGETTSLVAVGSGVRKKFVFKVYEGVAYVEEGVDLGDDPFTTLIEGTFAKGIHMFFERDVSGDKIVGAYRDGFKKVLGEKGKWDPNLAQDAEIFLQYFTDHNLKDGQSMDLYWLPGEGLFTVVVDESFPPVRNPDLASALWAIWFGQDPVSGDLKKDMIRFLSEKDS